MALTISSDLNRIILNYLSDPDLYQAIQTCRHLYHQSKQDEFWHQRLSLHLDHRYSCRKHPDLSWKEWYVFWKRHPKDPIGETLRLNPIQAYIRLQTEKGIMKGSEVYQHVRVLLPKALQSRDPDIIQYYLDLTRTKFQSYLEEKCPDRFFLDYGKTISIPLRNDDLILAKELLSLMSYDIKKCHRERNNFDLIDEEYRQLGILLGSINRRDLLDTLLYPSYNLSLYHGGWILENAFLVGLIEGHHNKEAKTMFKVIKEGYTFYYHVARGANNEEFADYLVSTGLIGDTTISTWKNFTSQRLSLYAYIQSGYYDKIDEWEKWIQQKHLGDDPFFLESSDYFDLQAYGIIVYIKQYPESRSILTERVEQPSRILLNEPC